MATKKGNSKGPGSSVIARTRRHDEYHIDETFEAGLALAGWEAKSLRAKRSSPTLHFNSQRRSVPAGQPYYAAEHGQHP